MPNTHETLTSLFTDIADAIRAKTGDTADIVADGFPDAIGDIETGITPSGKITITENGTDIDVSQYALADVDVSGGGGLPSGISDIKTGTFSVAEDTITYTVVTDWDTAPKAFLCILENPINRSASENYSLLQYYFQGFSNGSTTGSYTGYIYRYIASSGNGLSGGANGSPSGLTRNAIVIKAGTGINIKSTVRNRVTDEVETAIYRWYAIW